MADTSSAAFERQQPEQSEAVGDKVDGEAVSISAMPVQGLRAGVSPPLGLTVCIVSRANEPVKGICFRFPIFGP